MLIKCLGKTSQLPFETQPWSRMLLLEKHKEINRAQNAF